jgi:hypothetical protein
VRRVGIAMPFRGLLLKAKVATDEALKILGALDLYFITYERQPDEDGKLRPDSKVAQRVRRLPPEYVRSRLRFVYKSDRVRVVAVDPMEVTLKGSLGAVLRRGRFEVAVDQVKAVIAKWTKRKLKREPKPRGRHEHAMKADILAEYDRRCARTPPKPHTQDDLWEWAEKKLKNKKKYKNARVPVPHVETIGKWLREERGQSTT